MTRPKLVIITPLRNNAWVLKTFLKSGSSWADHIILSDQNSSDDTLLIAQSYDKVKVINYNSCEFDEGINRALLIEEARKIEGPRILFALDSDEVFTANFLETQDWQTIINSRPGDVFAFQWATICPDQLSYYPMDLFYPWVVNDDGSPYEKYVKKMHSMRIPYPESADLGWHKVTDFKVLHLEHVSPLRNISKQRFYKCTVSIQEPDVHFVSLHRDYNFNPPVRKPIPTDWLGDTIDLSLMDLTATIFWYDDEIIRFFRTYGFEKFKYLNIWDSTLMNYVATQLTVKDPRGFKEKLVLKYLNLTQHIKTYTLVRAIDKVIKLFY